MIDVSVPTSPTPTSTTPTDPALPVVAPPKTFDGWGLDPGVRQALDEMGYVSPMDVQVAVFEKMVAGKDLLVQSRTGSGKTAAFGIPLAQMNAPEDLGAKALILAPTRELALQISHELSRICLYRNLKVVPIYGGAPMGKQIEALKAGAQIIAGTPGRVLDHIRRGTMRTEGIRCLILDECDEMFSMGFQEEIENIIKELPKARQTLLFSATVPDEIKRIAKRHMKDYEELQLSTGHVGVNEIDHEYYLVSGIARTRDLLRVLDYEQPESAIIFCNTRDDTTHVAAFLTRHGHDAEALSGELAQSDRERVMARARDKNLKYLVATDVAARGIDISDLSHVINYAFPESPEVYVHRTGRTGRAGKSGTAISLVGPRELGAFYYLKLLYKIRPEERELPSDAELARRKEAEHWERIANEVPEEPGDEWRSLARRLWTSAEGERIVAALAKRLIEGAPTLVAKRTDAPAPAPRVVRTERVEPVAAVAVDGAAPVAEAPRFERAPRPERSDRDRGDRGDRPRRERSSRSSESFGERESPGRRAEREARGEAAPRPAEARPEGAREARPEGARSEGRGDRDRRPRGEGRGDRDRRPRRERATTERERPVSEASTPVPSEKALDPAGAGGREFWEAWVDDRAGAPAGAPTAPAAAATMVDASAEFDSAPTTIAPGNLPDRGEGGGERGDRATRRIREVPAEEPGWVRLYVNVGRREGLEDATFEALLGGSISPTPPVQRVKVLGTHTYVSVPEANADDVARALTGKKVGDREVIAERAKR